jgi:5-methylthioadenosine/S-adenosylhomocysteine deaminase
MRRLAADWLLPIDGPPVARGAVLVGTDGRVVAAGSDRAVPVPSGIRTERFAGAAIIPGLVNTHTHLELTGFDGLVPEADFPSWIRHVRALKGERAGMPSGFLDAARAGVRACWAAGVTTVADTGDSGAVARVLAELGGSGIAYQEVFGPDPDQVAESMAALEAQLAALGHCASARVRLGVSPHAPYSVSGPLYAAAARWARSRGLPLAVHVAESPEESALLLGSGAFAAGWRAREIPVPRIGCSPIEWLDRHDVLGPDTLCIHAVQAAPDDVARLAQRRAAVAHCPRSNARHNHGDAPLAALLAEGVRVGIGTDSVASVAPLDLLAEARAARSLAGLGARHALALCTRSAALALGLENEVGALCPAMWGDCAVVHMAGAEDPEEAVLASAPGDVLATYLGGRLVYARGGATAATETA